MQNFCGEFFCKIDSEILTIETTISPPICLAKQLSKYLEEKLNEHFVENKTMTHITTNLSASEIEKSYGNRLRSRMRNMFNVISFDADSIDKR